MEETKPFDMTPVQYALLVVMNECPAVDATRLSELISIDRATIGNVVHRLEAKGLVTRKPDPNDGRAKRIFVTPAGRKMIKAINAVRANISRRILAPLKQADRRMLMKLLEQLVDINDMKTRAKSYQAGRNSAGRAARAMKANGTGIKEASR